MNCAAVLAAPLFHLVTTYRCAGAPLLLWRLSAWRSVANISISTIMLSFTVEDFRSRGHQSCLSRCRCCFWSFALQNLWVCVYVCVCVYDDHSGNFRPLLSLSIVRRKWRPATICRSYILLCCACTFRRCTNSLSATNLQCTHTNEHTVLVVVVMQFISFALFLRIDSIAFASSYQRLCVCVCVVSYFNMYMHACPEIAIRRLCIWKISFRS